MCGAHSVHMARVAEEVGVQREALRAGLIGQLLAALLRVEERRRGEVSYGSLQNNVRNVKSSLTSQW